MPVFSEESDLGNQKIAIIWQRHLPYHVARIKHLRMRAEGMGLRLIAIEVAFQDESYGFPEDTRSSESICCFPGSSYHGHTAREIYDKVSEVLNRVEPDIVFCPATPFPEGMAAISYGRRRRKKIVMMDTAWERTDNRGFLTRQVKRLIHRNVDAAFIPAPSHKQYYQKLNFPEDRIIYGMNAVDNEYFSGMADKILHEPAAFPITKKLPANYFLFVGRFLQRKGIDNLIHAYNRYRMKCVEKVWNLVLVGKGPAFDSMSRLAENNPHIIFAGPQYADDLCVYYSMASVFVCPSISEPWGLVINEALASGLPVLVSTGCGAAKSLVRDGKNGWTFPPGDENALCKLMLRISALPPGELQEMWDRSREIIADWSLDRFADGALSALTLPKRPPAGPISDALTFLWKGHVRIN
ncbi:MAG: glycosyltransferase [Desulfobacteraceae bacterium]|nr:glycosyltransferase [Desulfobacteraceae bacterium]